MEIEPRLFDKVGPVALNGSGEDGGGNVLEGNEQDEEPDNDRDRNPLQSVGEDRCQFPDNDKRLPPAFSNATYVISVQDDSADEEGFLQCETR